MIILALEQLDGHLREGVRLGKREHTRLHEHLHLGEVCAFGGKVHLADGGFCGLHVHLGDGDVGHRGFELVLHGAKLRPDAVDVGDGRLNDG